MTLTIHSTPKTATTTADKGGDWSYTVTGLEPGNHYIVATVTDPSTKLTSTSAKLISFTLTAAKVPAVTAKAVTQPVAKTSSTGLFVALGVLAVLLLLGGGGWYGWRLRRKKHAGGTKPPSPTTSEPHIPPAGDQL